MSNCEIVVKYPDTKTKVVWLVPKISEVKND